MAKINNLQCVGDALFQGDVKVNGKLNNEVLDVDENCLLISFCKRLDTSVVGDKISIEIPQGYVGVPMVGSSYAQVTWNTQSSDSTSWSAILAKKYTPAGGTETTSTENIGSGTISYFSLSGLLEGAVEFSVDTASSGATYPYVYIIGQIYCYKES